MKPFSTAGIRKKYIAGIFCDLTKAFDCVNHELVLSKLKFCGVRSVVIEWLKSYQYNRKQRVHLEFIKTYCYSSGWDTLKCGVLQGYVLDLLLFNIYINNFPKIINKISHTLLFSDDTSILVTSSNYIEVNQKSNSILHHISKWFQTNQFVVNTNKIYIVKFTYSCHIF